ncbi:O-acetyl-ADP-ribose deacetylase [Mycoplasmatota bacterium]|nr:O-acetyl-ADP-ribose deacetylase [Mycoplasmatota bacterium]
MTNITIFKGDITKIKVDAIVNAANSSLLGGGGVDGAIHKAGGKKILEECMLIRNKKGSCKTGEAVITTAGRLEAKYVIHTVGPVWNGGNNNEQLLLKNCYLISLKLAVDNGVKSIAFPNISTGIYKFPKQLAAKIAIKTIQDFVETDVNINEIILVCYDEENYKIYLNIIEDNELINIS